MTNRSNRSATVGALSTNKPFLFSKRKNRQCAFNIIMSKPILERIQISMFAKQRLLRKTCPYYTQRFFFFSAVKIENFIIKKRRHFSYFFFFFFFLLKTLIVGIHTCLTEAVLTSIHNQCYGAKIRK